jgi:two-component system sensor histidine kinase AlgZ
VTARRRLFVAVGWTIAGSFGAAFAFGGATWQTPWRALVVQTLVNSMFSGCCVTLCVAGLPWVVPRVRRRFTFPLDWAVILVTLVLFGVTGSLIGTAIGVVVGVVPSSRFLTVWYPGTLQVSVYLTLIFGISGTALEEVRARLETTTLALRTKERDEAEARRLVAEARLASLESRVDPHFLFNTLNSIAALVRDRPGEAERVIEQLSSLMRSSLDRAQPLVTVEEELEVVRSYLEIEQVRFGGRLRFCLECTPDAASGHVPRLALQTLVENSVKYAVSPTRDGAAISVKAARHRDRLQIAVEDDGPGFDAAYLPEGHGLHLLKSRVALTFGQRGDVAVTSRKGWTAVTLDLPFETTS